MIESFLTDLGLEGEFARAGVAASIFLIGLILAGIFDKLIYPIILRFTNWTPTDLDARLTRSFRKPLSFGILLLGLYLAITLTYSPTGHLHFWLDRAAIIGFLLLALIGISAAVSNIFQWYSEVISPRTESGLDDRLVPMLRRMSAAVVYGLGALLALDLLNVNISPLIAGLGLSGLAVALALQPTLSNLFAGTYVMTEGVVAPGDYIEMENGIAGYVIDVSWRSTRLRTWTNNMVVVPNSRFAETIITNYQGPQPAVNVYLTCGVSYDSDLYAVERICHEIMADMLENDPRAVQEYGGWFGFETFDDSNVGFYLFVQARDRLASFEVQSALIQRVHQRFREEGIAINYPMRTLHFPEGRDFREMSRSERWAAIRRETAATSGNPSPNPPPSGAAPDLPGAGGDGGGPDVG